MTAAPKYYARYICAACGAGATVDVDPITHSSKRPDGQIELSVVHAVPEGWNRFGANLYCEKHKIEIATQVRIDGVTTETVRDYHKPVENA